MEIGVVRDAHGTYADALAAVRDDQCIPSRHDRNAVEPAEGIRDEGSGEVVLGAQRVAIDGAGVVARPCPLGDDEPPVVGAPQAVVRMWRWVSMAKSALGPPNGIGAR